MFVRGAKTVEYIKSLGKKDIAKQSGEMRRQDNLLKEFIEVSIAFVYASRIMREDIKNMMQQLPEKFAERGHSVDVYFLECLSPSEGKFVKVD